MKIIKLITLITLISLIITMIVIFSHNHSMIAHSSDAFDSLFNRYNVAMSILILWYTITVLYSKQQEIAITLLNYFSMIVICFIIIFAIM